MVLPALTALKTSGVQSWLGQELEMRGIDAMIYTRYILSILLQEDVDEMAEVDIDGGSGFGRKMGYVKVKGKKKGRVDKEELKKTAAVQCLQSVSDQDAGIESLVEELCYRLKELQAQKVICEEKCGTQPNTSGVGGLVGVEVNMLPEGHRNEGQLCVATMLVVVRLSAIIQLLNSPMNGNAFSILHDGPWSTWLTVRLSAT
uniref:Uncharacterized protein n=1 Tax=Branchiostoma floridae TaxID=7739 RepID=C3Y410_BRAFL|eukprot:XP_002609026.1 hypothetical protein BRAFLDRAFT_84842 [Branchiostoma floridae]